MLSVDGFAPAGQPVRRWPCSFASVARDDLEEGAASGDFDAMERVCRDLEANAHPERQFCAREVRNTTGFSRAAGCGASITRSGAQRGPPPADGIGVEEISIERRLGRRTVIQSRPDVEVHYRRRAALRTKTDQTAAQLVQVSISGALLVTAAPMPSVEVGQVIQLVVQRDHSSVVVRRIDEHHDMTLYGVEFVTTDAWLQALIDRAVQAGRGDLVAAWNRAS
jgi:hypothetical protein